MSSVTIEVTFIDQRTGQPFLYVDTPIEQLPQSFAPATRITIGDVEWQVVTAEPVTVEEFSQTGKLTLTLAKIMKMPVRNILYTLPTITNAIPETLPGTSQNGKHVLVIHEDDWRQIELVAASYNTAIREQFDGIRRIYNEEAVDNGAPIIGFRTLYVRSLIEPPIVEAFTQEELMAALPAPFETFDGIAYEQGMNSSKTDLPMPLAISHCTERKWMA